MVSSMKTTIDIAESLLAESKLVAEREHTTLRELVQEGLRKVVQERKSASQPYRLPAVVFGGGGFQAEFADGDWSRIRDAIYEGRGA